MITPSITEGSLPSTMADHRSSASSSRSSSTNLLHSFRSLAKQLLRLGRRPKDDGASTFTRSEINEDDGSGNGGNGKAPTNKRQLSREAAESLLAQAFTGMSAVKAAYAQLQIAQSPYDPEAIQRYDCAVVAELKHLSYLKHSYLRGYDQFSLESRIFAEIQEQRNVIRTFEITIKNMESILRGKDREIRSLRDRYLESEEQNVRMESKLQPESSVYSLENLHISALDPTHFVRALRYARSSVRHFVEHLADGEESSAAAESCVCIHMFSGFDRPRFGIGQADASRSLDHRRFFDEFKDLRRKSLRELLDGEGESERRFQGFCCAKYEALRVRDARQNVSTVGRFLRFAEVARRVWLLHLLFRSFEAEAEASIFVAPRGCRYSEVYMEVAGKGVAAEGKKAVVAFTVAPGFKVRRTVIQCQVYLEGRDERS